MGIDGEQVLKTHLRERKYAEMIDELNGLIYGVGARVSSVTAPGGAYSERATLAFIDDVLHAYSIYPSVVDVARWRGVDLGDSVDYDEREALLDAEQTRFLKSLLYCMMRLVADSPWYLGSFFELECACDTLVDSFAIGLPREEFWEAELDCFAGKPHAPADLGFAPGVAMASWFPILEPLSEPAAMFLDHLNWIYEALSGEAIVDRIPRRQRERIQGELDRHREEERTEREARDGERAGAEKNAEALKEALGDRLEMPAAGEEPEDDGWDDSDWPGGSKAAYEEMVARETAEREQWAEGFSRKEEWCKRYLAMRRSYFKLGGIGPIDTESYPYAKAIDVATLDRAIESALDAHRVAHFTDGAFKVLYAKMRETVVSVQRAIAQEQGR